MNLLEAAPGETLGRYELLLPVARGGMAVVWAARLKGSRGFEKLLAVKTMLPGMSDTAIFEQMFLDEAKLASRVRSPHVVEILDLGEEHGVLYIVMEWVDGEPLNEVMKEASRQGPFPAEIAASIVMQACAGLHTAHELKSEDGQPLGLVHRDISPHNILVGFEGIVKVSDFGIAKAMALGGSSTEVGEVKGKTAYMSPEQAIGGDLDRRSDVFALGIVLYQLATGTHPFRGHTDGETIANIVLPDPPRLPSTIVQGFPAEVEAVILKALSKSREDRYPSAAALMEALGKALPSASGGLGYEKVGAFVESLLGERRAARREKIRSAIGLAEARAASAETGRPPAPVEARRSRGRLLAYGGVALAAVAAIAFLLKRPAAPSSGAPNVAAGASVAVAPAQPSSSVVNEQAPRSPPSDTGAVPSAAPPNVVQGGTSTDTIKTVHATGRSTPRSPRTKEKTEPLGTRISPVRSPGF